MPHHMRAARAHRPAPEICVRPAQPDDLIALLALEDRAFTSDRMSRRSMRRFLNSPHAEMNIAELDRDLIGHALILFRPNSAIARLYSLAVDPAHCRHGVGQLLIAAAEHTAWQRQCARLRLEVHDKNAAAVALYQKAGYRLFGHHPHYYQDKGNALRFEKDLVPAR
jgi:ribosomal protein S18 acetylase RimI-like enzyme